MTRDSIWSDASCPICRLACGRQDGDPSKVEEIARWG